MPKSVFKMTYSDAKSLMSAAVKSADKHKVSGAIAIVDKGGHPMLLESLENTMSGASKIAIGKAATCVAFMRPSKDIESVIMEGRTPMLVLDGALSNAYVPLKGGYPIWYKNELIGGIAVAGTMDAEMDEVVVLEALENKGW
ncbi:GlcG/HbpS family heme-binding protein [Flavivirga algicola]|uniref:Heme-binding protein n=1 Tax=Flavivirga algicola TaxID=2729136 RepID=A0ABX1S157_9FLAO|nr:heme-binding protein [Flavivirga algicola]NMH88357.1 heme-binding protein [Flavivirga algicola]